MTRGKGAGGASHLVYVVSDALRSLRSNLASTVLTSFTVGFSLAIFSLFFLVFINLNGVIDQWGEKTHVIAYVKDGDAAKAGDGKRFISGLEKISGVSGAKYISREAAFEELKKELSSHESILEGVSPSALPASVEITVDEARRSAEALSELVAEVGALDWVAEVTYSREWVERFSALVGFVELGALVIGAFLAAATLFIISNTIRLTVYARKEEIEIMRLVGASDRFIKFPFFIEAVAQGIGGGVVSLGLLALGRGIVESKIPPYLGFALDYPVPLPAMLAVLILAGMVLGIAGSFISMSRFLKV